jgi:hypothetical protein
VRESGRANRATPDTKVLEFASSEKRAVLTMNRKHFIALHALTPDRAGIVVLYFMIRWVRGLAELGKIVRYVRYIEVTPVVAGR